MFNNSMGYSLADIAAVTEGAGNNNGWGNGDGAWWIILFLLALGGGWGNGYGFGGNRGGSTTREEISYGFDMNNLENGIRGIQQGLCDGFYALNNAVTGGNAAVQNALCQGFNGINTSLLQGFCGIQGQMAQDALVDQKCCCETQNIINSNFANLNYNLATQGCDTRRAIADSTRDIIDANNNNTRQIIDFLVNDKISTLQAENQSLKFKASQAEQNAFITANQQAQTAELIRRLGADCPVNAYVVQPPTPVTFPTNCCGQFTGFNNNGCAYNY
jgi:hypothetical protein